MAFTTRLTKVGHGSEHFNERTGMCYHQTPPWERVVGHVRDAGQAKPHLEHNPLSLLGACYATSRRQLNDPARPPLMSTSVTTGAVGAASLGGGAFGASLAGGAAAFFVLPIES